MIGAKAKIGNFVELKKSRIGRGSKAKHLSYIGDATIGDGVNIGAGAITCNYDGVTKHETKIGDGAFVGTNASLVAPLTIGEGAYVAAGCGDHQGRATGRAGRRTEPAGDERRMGRRRRARGHGPAGHAQEGRLTAMCGIVGYVG